MFLTGTSEELIKRVIEECPHGRLGETKDVAPLVGFLASDASEWINGRLLVLMVALSRVWLVQYFEICILYINATIIPVI
jgi:NAD(P)-dependent dehydrogenase (short-subunit alcohol dehydrogenase family)